MCNWLPPVEGNHGGLHHWMNVVWATSGNFLQCLLVNWSSISTLLLSHIQCVLTAWAILRDITECVLCSPLHCHGNQQIYWWCGEEHSLCGILCSIHVSGGCLSINAIPKQTSVYFLHQRFVKGSYDIFIIKYAIEIDVTIVVHFMSRCSLGFYISIIEMWKLWMMLSSC